MTLKTVSMLLAGLVLLIAANAQSGEGGGAEDVWEPLRYFEGTWKGTGQGPGGANELECSFGFVMSGRYLCG